FDFGQFVIVHSESEGDAGGQPPEKVVIDPTGGKYGAYRSWLEQFRRSDLVKIGPRPPERDRGPLRDPLGGVSLFQLVDSRGPTAWAPLEIPVASEELADVIRKGR
ncbi:hypothetical protein, partial [Streptomyces anandii]|uniref:hypothetical protein n=1 Tax=Streptomyces anandii TaxID=285454 RepID=UPI0016750ABB